MIGQPMEGINTGFKKVKLLDSATKPLKEELEFIVYHDYFDPFRDKVYNTEEVMNIIIDRIEGVSLKENLTGISFEAGLFCGNDFVKDINDKDIHFTPD